MLPRARDADEKRRSLDVVRDGSDRLALSCRVRLRYGKHVEPYVLYLAERPGRDFEPPAPEDLGYERRADALFACTRVPQKALEQGELDIVHVVRMRAAEPRLRHKHCLHAVALLDQLFFDLLVRREASEL